jgi:hypothetical protein
VLDAVFPTTTSFGALRQIPDDFACEGPIAAKPMLVNCSESVFVGDPT